MKSKVLWALVALNVLLLAALVSERFSPAAHAAAAPARPGDYLLIPGQVTGGNSEVVYILDETNRMLTARYYDANAKGFSDMAPINLDRFFQGAGGGAAAGAGGGR
jgi:hypothetical protein